MFDLTDISDTDDEDENGDFDECLHSLFHLGII